jgi:hypothetical protein
MNGIIFTYAHPLRTMDRRSIRYQKIFMKIININLLFIALIIFNIKSKCIYFNYFIILLLIIPISSLVAFEIIGTSLSIDNNVIHCLY